MMTVKTTMAAASISVTWKEERRETMHLIGTERVSPLWELNKIETLVAEPAAIDWSQWEPLMIDMRKKSRWWHRVARWKSGFL